MIPTAEELVERVRMAFAESGFPDVEVGTEGTMPDGWPVLYWRASPGPSLAVAWQAAWVAYEGHVPCWSCWGPNSGSNEAWVDCYSGHCHHPEGPARPPREELVRR